MIRRSGPFETAAILSQLGARLRVPPCSLHPRLPRRRPGRWPAALWLARRQVRHVAAHRAAVPAGFADAITLARAPESRRLHPSPQPRRHAGDARRQRALLLVLTLGGGLHGCMTSGPAHLAGLPLGIALHRQRRRRSALADLPFALYRTFVIEARFGFNRMTLALFVADLIQPRAARRRDRRPGPSRRALADGSQRQPVVALRLDVLDAASTCWCCSSTRP